MIIVDTNLIAKVGSAVMNVRLIGSGIVLFMCLMALSISSASYGYISSQGKIVKDLRSYSISNVCQRLLLQTNMSQTSEFQGNREKSMAMAAGILFGARYAVENTNNSPYKSQKVQKIKEFRECQKLQILKSQSQA